MTTYKDGRGKTPTVATLLLGAQLLIAAAAAFFVWFRGIESPHCGARCDYNLLYQAGVGFAIFAALVWAASATVVIFGWRLGFKSWLAPAVGMVLTIGGALVANSLASIALLY